MTTAFVRRFAIAYFGFQAIAVAAWWVVLVAWPASRAPFKSSDAPDSVLLAFIVADLLLVAVASGIVALGLHWHTRWAWPVLLIHTGAAAYAGLYCLTVFIQNEGSGWIAAVLMFPSLSIIPWFAWRLRPDGTAP